MRVRAFAKINLSLRIVGRRPDGYHELQTVFQSIALHDVLIVRRRPGPLTLTCDDPACPTDHTNLVWRAAERLWRASGKRGAPRGVSIHLVKQIPIQAGLGGGSSDAAAAIRALGRLWRVRPLRQRAIAAALGADIPYFFEGGTVLGLDRGDRLFPLLDRPPAWVVLAIPSFGVSTKDAFGWHDVSLRERSRGRGRADMASARSARRQIHHAQNDLELVVAKRHPQIARLVRALGRAGASQAAMSGSGSTVFGLFDGRTAAIEAAAALVGRDVRTLVTKTLDRRAYQGLAGGARYRID
jgi:4-diphosphocytidyl-2-C-methyl-D-erythritol kinase